MKSPQSDRSPAVAEDGFSGVRNVTRHRVDPFADHEQDVSDETPEPHPLRWLFTLKALAFIHLRRGEREAARGLVTQLLRLDPADHLGASVVETLLHKSA